MNEFEKAQSAKILSCYGIDIEKGRNGLPIGTKKTWGGKEYTKTNDGWKEKVGGKDSFKEVDKNIEKKYNYQTTHGKDWDIKNDIDDKDKKDDFKKLSMEDHKDLSEIHSFHEKNAKNDSEKEHHAKMKDLHSKEHENRMQNLPKSGDILEFDFGKNNSEAPHEGKVKIEIDDVKDSGVINFYFLENGEKKYGQMVEEDFIEKWLPNKLSSKKTDSIKKEKKEKKELYSDAESKLKFIKKFGSMITFKNKFVPDEMKMFPEFGGKPKSQVISDGKLEKNDKGQVRIVGNVFDSPWFDSQEDLLNAIDWDGMREMHTK